VATTTLTCACGLGGKGVNASSPNLGISSAGGAATNGDLNVTGAASLFGLAFSANSAIGGTGGNSPFGSAQAAVSSFTNSVAARAGTGFGSGGTGGSNSGAILAAIVGADGAPGESIVDEYA
jgi:hypothetical protein